MFDVELNEQDRFMLASLFFNDVTTDPLIGPTLEQWFTSKFGSLGLRLTVVEQPTHYAFTVFGPTEADIIQFKLVHLAS